MIQIKYTNTFRNGMLVLAYNTAIWEYGGFEAKAPRILNTGIY
jgi:hypothetical protein